MSGRGDNDQYKENISVMKSCHEKRIKDLEENILMMKSCYKKQIERANERIEDLEEVGSLFLF